MTMLALNRLLRHDRSVLVTQIAGGKALPDEVIDQIIDRTIGRAAPMMTERAATALLALSSNVAARMACRRRL